MQDYLVFLVLTQDTNIYNLAAAQKLGLDVTDDSYQNAPGDCQYNNASAPAPSGGRRLLQMNMNMGAADAAAPATAAAPAAAPTGCVLSPSHAVPRLLKSGPLTKGLTRGRTVPEEGLQQGGEARKVTRKMWAEPEACNRLRHRS